MKIRQLTSACLAFALLGGCASVPRGIQPPLRLFGDDGSWTGALTAKGLTIAEAGRVVLAAPPEHLVPGRNQLLFNARTGEKGYLSILVDPARCRAGGRTYPYSVYFGIQFEDGASKVRHGCAAPAGSAEVTRFLAGVHR